MIGLVRGPVRGPVRGLKRVDAQPRSAHRWSVAVRVLAIAAVPALLVLAGCGGGNAAANSSNGTFSIAPGTGTVDTNCTGCNATNSSGASVEQFSATLASGGAAAVTWKVSGGDTNSGAGTITASGQYTPPSYLTADHVSVTVTATMNSTVVASAVLTVTPGFLQPLTPENAAIGANGTLSITGYIAEAGGSTADQLRAVQHSERFERWTGFAGHHQLHARAAQRLLTARLLIRRL